MLGGYGKVSNVELATSIKFLSEFIDAGRVGTDRAIDCGAGIGRITKTLLVPRFKEVDLLE